jgi:hypothetical protein
MRILLQNRFEKIMFYEALTFGQFESVVISSPLDRSPNRAEATPRPRPQVVLTKNIFLLFTVISASSTFFLDTTT